MGITRVKSKNEHFIAYPSFISNICYYSLNKNHLKLTSLATLNTDTYNQEYTAIRIQSKTLISRYKSI